MDDRLAEPPSEPPASLTEAERSDLEVSRREFQDYWDRVHEELRLDAQACARAMRYSPQLADPMPPAFEDVVSTSLDDYRSGRSLMDQLGASRLLDPATTGVLLAIRRGLIDETGATTTAEMLLIDMAVVAYANAMRVQSIMGNTALLIEAELFGQPSLRAKWKRTYGDRAADVRGLAVDEHVTRISEQLMLLLERFHRLGRESIEALGRARQTASVTVERAKPVRLVFA